MAEATSENRPKHNPDQLWSMGLMDKKELAKSARQQANEMAEASVFRLFMIVTFCIVFLVCRYYML